MKTFFYSKRTIQLSNLTNIQRQRWSQELQWQLPVVSSLLCHTQLLLKAWRTLHNQSKQPNLQSLVDEPQRTQMSKQTVECCKHLHSKQTVNIIKIKLIIVFHSKNFKGGRPCINLLILIVIIISTFYSHRFAFTHMTLYFSSLLTSLSPCLPNHLYARSNPCRIFSLVLLLLFNYIFLLLTSTPALFSSISSTSLFSILFFTISSLCFIHSLLSYLSLQSHSPSRSICSFSLLFVPRT